MAIVFGGLPTIAMGLIYDRLAEKTPDMSAAFVFMLVVLFPIWILFGTYYRLTDKALVIRSGPFRWTILFKDIHSVNANPKRSEFFAKSALISVIGLSTNGVRVNHGRQKSMLLSPTKKEEFLVDLRTKLSGKGPEVRDQRDVVK
jgi:hypothetical protein